MARTMRAAVVEQFGKPLVLRELDVLSPGPGQILVKTEACGVCHTDIYAAHGDWPVKPALPFIPGHEAIGLVAAIGSGVTLVKEGDRVGVPWLYSACGHCEYCLTAWEAVCAEAQFGGYIRNGGFVADYLLADPNYVARVPAGLAAREAAPLICAGITTYKGIKENAARPGEWIAISGTGGLGHLAIQYAKAMGLQVCAIDIDDGKLAHATCLGADSRSRCSMWWRTASRPRLVRRHAPGYGRSARLCRRWQGQGRYRAAAAVVDQPGPRPAGAWPGGVTRGPRVEKLERLMHVCRRRRSEAWTGLTGRPPRGHASCRVAHPASGEQETGSRR